MAPGQSQQSTTSPDAVRRFEGSRAGACPFYPRFGSNASFLTAYFPASDLTFILVHVQNETPTDPSSIELKETSEFTFAVTINSRRSH
jgi:hypothetical protein